MGNTYLSSLKLLIFNPPRGSSFHGILAAVPLIILILTGCSTSRSTTSAYQHIPKHLQVGSDAGTNQIKKSPPRTIQKWNPVWWLGNSDDPIPPDWYRPDDPHRSKKWYFRNPFHNFTFYVIGIADKPFVRVGPFPDRVHNPNGGWLWAISKYKWVRLPYVSYKAEHFKFYLGWRNRGNFGAKVVFGREKPKNRETNKPN